MRKSSWSGLMRLIEVSAQSSCRNMMASYDLSPTRVKKLNGAESRYATVEKECLATVWGMQKFERYLNGRRFTLETDHQPLKCLQKQPTNPRLMRWALQLQPYAYTVQVIPGRDNHGADYLSRASYD
ncbi:hypothetical protein V1264_018042 [Littorina saxatilis]|uniref:Reverse transcriptase RNase H-like domain-containing protein n=1 Tax=Littorina saxatilis TaxID=31220 RepID=A0AAN9BKI1_9CAEN